MVTRSDARASFSWNLTSSAVYVGLTVVTVAPAQAIPWNSTAYSGQFGAMIAMHPPGASPLSVSPPGKPGQGRSLSHEIDVAPAELRRHLATYEENRDLVLMGAYRAGADAQIDAAIACHDTVLDYIRQAYDETVSLDEAVTELVGVFGDG